MQEDMIPGEKKFLSIFLPLLAIVLVAPYVYGYLICPPEKFYMWLPGLNGSDSCFYLAWGPKQAANGYWLFEDKLNGYTERRLVFNPLWLGMGWVSSLFDISVITVHHIQRIFFSLLLVLFIYKIAKEFFEESRWKISALLLAVLSSGFYIHSIEANIFMSMLSEVNLPAANLLFLLCIFYGYRTFFKNENKGITTGLLALILALVYPYAVISVYFIFFAASVFQLIRRKHFTIVFTSYLKIFFLSVPVVLYDGYLVLTDPKLTEGQAFFSSPSLLEYFLSLGVISLFGLAGTYFIVQQKKEQHYFLIIWTFVTILQTYIPLSLIPFQVQLILGIQVPLAIIAVYGIREIYFLIKNTLRQVPEISKTAVVMYLLLIIALASPYNVGQYYRSFTDMKKSRIPSYMNNPDKEAIDWLAANTDDSDHVVASPPISPYIPVLANNRMYSSDYYAPTANFAQKEKEIKWLFNPGIEKSDKDILDFLSKNRIDYIFHDKHLPDLDWDKMKERFSQIPLLEKEFENEAVTIFKYQAD